MDNADVIQVGKEQTVLLKTVLINAAIEANVQMESVTVKRDIQVNHVNPDIA